MVSVINSRSVVWNLTWTPSSSSTSESFAGQPCSLLLMTCFFSLIHKNTLSATILHTVTSAAINLDDTFPPQIVTTTNADSEAHCHLIESSNVY